MSNLIFRGYSFSEDLLARWYLQNTVSLNPSETQEMALQVLDSLNQGFELVTQTPYGKNPNLVLRSLLNNNKTDLLSFDGNTSLLKATVPLDMGKNTIQNVADPVDNQDVATKGFVLSHANTGTGFSYIKSITSSGTWTVPEGITKLKLTLIGGGGGGAGGGGAGGARLRPAEPHRLDVHDDRGRLGRGDGRCAQGDDRRRQRDGPREPGAEGGRPRGRDGLDDLEARVH